MGLGIKKIMAFNQNQIEHVQLVQKMVLDFCHTILMSAIEHDTSKFGDMEYKGFVERQGTLRKSATGTDEQYQKDFLTDAIQHHVVNNPHHPEYWDKLGQPMPVSEVISMFFDWRSRAIAKGTSMVDFWEYNVAKLKNQPHALVIVEALKREYADKLTEA